MAQDLDDGTIGEIRDALNEHCVVFFRDQTLDAERQKAFARRFGELFIHPNYKGMGDDPEIVMVRREPGDTSYVGQDWHADTTMVAEPPKDAPPLPDTVPPTDTAAGMAWAMVGEPPKAAPPVGVVGVATVPDT